MDVTGGVVGLVLAAGPERGLCGSVSGAHPDTYPDALCSLGAVPLVGHAVRALRRSGSVDAVAVCIRSWLADRVRSALDTHVPDHRATLLPAEDPEPIISMCRSAGVVVVHHCLRPLAPADLVAPVVAAVRQGADVAVPVVPVTETVKELDADGWIVRTVARDALRHGQSPWAVRSELFVDQVRDDWPQPTPRCRSGRLVTVAGHPDAFTLDTAAHLDLAAAVLRARLAPDRTVR